MEIRPFQEEQGSGNNGDEVNSTMMTSTLSPVDVTSTYITTNVLDTLEI
jgi:hypothetical protein